MRVVSVVVVWSPMVMIMGSCSSRLSLVLVGKRIAFMNGECGTFLYGCVWLLSPFFSLFSPLLLIDLRCKKPKTLLYTN